jgi:GNAT superfamily N-acetyltransferase
VLAPLADTQLEPWVSKVTIPLTIIRRAGFEDATEVFAVHQRSVQALCAPDYSAEHMATWFTGRSADIYLPALQAGQLWVAEADGQILGFVGAEPGEVTLLFVAPEAAGRSIGGRLFEFALQRASENFPGPLTVIATRNSVSFYRRYGFVGVEELSFVRGDPPLHYPVVKMVRNPVTPVRALQLGVLRPRADSGR